MASDDDTASQSEITSSEDDDLQEKSAALVLVAAPTIPTLSQTPEVSGMEVASNKTPGGDVKNSISKDGIPVIRVPLILRRRISKREVGIMANAAVILKKTGTILDQKKSAAAYVKHSSSSRRLQISRPMLSLFADRTVKQDLYGAAELQPIQSKAARYLPGIFGERGWGQRNKMVERL